VLALEHVVIIYLGLAAAAVGALGLRALFLGVCEHLEADDIPLTARTQPRAAAIRAPVLAVSRRAFYPAAAQRRPATAYPGLHLGVHR
jgi:hypothetical protein